MEIGTHESISLVCIHKRGSANEGMVWCEKGHDASRCDICPHKNTQVKRTTTTFAQI